MERMPERCAPAGTAWGQRQCELERELRRAVRTRVELPDGFALAFPGDARWLAPLAEAIGYERECCPFLVLELVAEPDRGPLWLRLKGPAGAKAFLARALEGCGGSG